jgi:hypothetical protein
MRTLSAIIGLLCLTACDSPSDVHESRSIETAPRSIERSVPAGASVAQARTIRAANDHARRPKAPPAFSTLGGAEHALNISRAILVDEGTGCQYVVRAMYQDAIDLSPRNERDPTSPDGTRHRCGTPIPGSNAISVLPGDDRFSIRASIEIDRDTGCQQIVATYWQDDVETTPRISAHGDARMQVCGTERTR